MSRRPERIARIVIERAGGRPEIGVFTEPELERFYEGDAPAGWLSRVVDGIVARGHYDDSDEDFLVLFIDAAALPR